MVIGSEMSGGVRNVTISNCTFVGTDRGIRLKSRRGRGAAVEDIRWAVRGYALIESERRPPTQYRTIASYS